MVLGLRLRGEIINVTGYGLKVTWQITLTKKIYKVFNNPYNLELLTPLINNQRTVHSSNKTPDLQLITYTLELLISY